MMIITGEIAFAIDADGGRLRLTPASTFSVAGDPDPQTWVYTLTMPGPSATVTRTLAADRVLHLTYSVESDRPWRGVGPLTGAASTAYLLNQLEAQLGNEAGGAVGTLYPFPRGRRVWPSRRSAHTQGEVGPSAYHGGGNGPGIRRGPEG